MHRDPASLFTVARICTAATVNFAFGVSGTHHEYAPDDSSRPRVEEWLGNGVKDTDKPKYASPASMVCLFADFLICPIEPFKEGSVQQAEVKSASHRHYIEVGTPKCFARGSNH